MLRGTEGKRNLLVWMGVILVCIGILLASRTLLTKHLGNETETGEYEDTVLSDNNIDIPSIDQENPEAYSIEINGNKPYFTSEEIENAKSEGYYISLSELDPKSRAQAAIMCADAEHIRTEERENDMNDLKPSGWHGNAIYQRSHLLMWKLSGPDEIQNLITGTEYFNQVEMFKYEKLVTGYLWNNEKNHVLYRVTPYYEGEELVARGVLMEAYSLEDEGAFSMCRFVYNAQPGSEVVYESGAYHMKLSWEEALGKSADELLEGDTQEAENLDDNK